MLGPAAPLAGLPSPATRFSSVRKSSIEDATMPTDANVVDGERPSTLPRLDDLQLSLESFQCRQKVWDVVKDYRGLLHAHWTLNNTGRKAKRKGER